MYQVIAYQIASEINISRCKRSLSYELKFSDSDELFYKLQDDSYVYVFQFGMISFFNAESEKIKDVIECLKPSCSNYFSEKLSEDVQVTVGESVAKVEFNKVVLPSLDIEALRLVMLYTSQSVALDRYSEITEKLLIETNKHTKYLQEFGKLDISGNKLKRFIGKSLNVKNGILENLYIFDSPDITWENEQLNILNRNLKQSFDLKDRYRRIHERLEIIKENLDLFKDLLHHRESSWLELIIIALIVIEVVDLFISKIS